MCFIQQSWSDYRRQAETSEVLVVQGERRIARSGASRKWIQHRVMITHHAEGQAFFGSQLKIFMGDELVAVILGGSVWSYETGDAGRYGGALDEGLRERIESGRIDDGLRSQSRVRLKVRVGHKKRSDARIGPALDGVRKVSTQLCGRECPLLRIHGCGILPLPLIAEEPEEAVSAVDDFGDCQRAAGGNAELISD